MSGSLSDQWLNKLCTLTVTDLMVLLQQLTCHVISSYTSRECHADLTCMCRLLQTTAGTTPLWRSLVNVLLQLDVLLRLLSQR